MRLYLDGGAISIPWHALPSSSSQIRNLPRAWDYSFQGHGSWICLERCTDLTLMLKDQGTYWDALAGKNTACISRYLSKYYACYNHDLPLCMERQISAKPEIHELLNKHVLYKPRDLEFLLHLWDQFLQVGQIHQQVQFLQEGQFVPFPPVDSVVLKIIWDWHEVSKCSLCLIKMCNSIIQQEYHIDGCHLL